MTPPEYVADAETVADLPRFAENAAKEKVRWK